MRIAIDAHHIGERRTGTETYLYNLVQNLAALEANGERYSVYLNDSAVIDGLNDNDHFEAKRLPFLRQSIRYGIYYPLVSWLNRFDVLHAQFALPPSLRSRSVVTVHDLCYERHPEYFHPTVRRQMKWLVPWSCRRADQIITVSESSKRDLVEIYRISPDKVTVTYPGAAERFKPMDRASAKQLVDAKYGVAGDFLVYVGNLEPRKNLGRLLEAFFLLRHQERIAHKLVIVGQAAWKAHNIFQAVEREGLGNEVVFTGYVPDQDLPFLYNASSGLVYPSVFEGFGLPVVEAMACGIPVITSSGSSLEEIAGNAALLVDPYSICSIADAIEKLGNDSSLRQKLAAAAIQRAACFSYRRMAEETREVYHRLQ